MEKTVVIITGASSGIGRATAHELASRGARLVLAARDRRALQDVVEECEERGGEAIAVPADVTRETDVMGLIQRALDAFGGVDVWINNASIGLFARFDLAPADVYRRVMETNFFGYVHGARAVLPLFREQQHGILINVDSVTGGAPQPFASAYVASKYAVRGWSACLRMELILDQLKDVHVCNVMPSAIDTPFFQHAANFTGRGIKALRPTYAADQVADAIADLINDPKPEVVVGAAGKAVLAQASMSQRAYEHLMARHYDRDHFKNVPSKDTEGNAFDSIGPKEVSGGWREPESRGARVGSGLATAAVFGALAFLALRKMR